tara:strand:+ start:76757 stop:77569 length:813 start_codon:yes stop_codon:yes gene_type:complete
MNALTANALTANALTAPLAIALILFAVPSCTKKDKEKDTKPEQATPVATPENKPESVAVGLSMDVVKAATGLAQSGSPWGEAIASLEAHLGKVTTIHGSEYRWAARSTDSCVYLSVEQLAGDAGATVGVVDGPTTTKASGDVDAWNRCMDSLGAQTPEDATAPMPPSSEGLVTVTSLLDGIARRPSAWVGARVTVEGFYVSTSTASVGESDVATVMVAEAKNNIKLVIGCSLKPGTEVSEFSRWDAVTVVGTAHGDFGGGLGDCRVAANE